MKRIFQSIKTGELIYFANDDSPECKKFLKDKLEEYVEWFTMQGK